MTVSLNTVASFVVLEEGELKIADLSDEIVAEGEYKIDLTLDDSKETSNY